MSIRIDGTIDTALRTPERSRRDRAETHATGPTRRVVAPDEIQRADPAVDDEMVTDPTRRALEAQAEELQSGFARLQRATYELERIDEVLQRLRELAQVGADEQLAEEQRAGLEVDFQRLLSELDAQPVPPALDPDTAPTGDTVLLSGALDLDDASVLDSGGVTALAVIDAVDSARAKVAFELGALDTESRELEARQLTAASVLADSRDRGERPEDPAQALTMARRTAALLREAMGRDGSGQGLPRPERITPLLAG